MKTKQTKRVTKLSKQEKAAQLELPGFRVVVRGEFGGKRIRRVKTVHAANDGVAMELAGNDAALLKGIKLDTVYITVLPPVSKAA